MPNVGVRRVVHVGNYAREAFHSNYDIAPDSKSFVFVRRGAEESGSTVTVLVNWIPLRKGASVP